MAKQKPAATPRLDADLWQKFYKTAAQFRDLAPWEWLFDSDIFGVQHPETGEIGWCCIMGNAGEHFALAVYRGAAGYQSFLNLAEAEPSLNSLNPEALNAAQMQNCLMVSFEDAAMVPPENKKHLKSLDLKFRGAGQWIVAQSFDPGFYPWLPDEKELPFFIHCLQQAMDVGFRSEDDPDLLGSGEEFLVRVPKKQKDGSLLWEDQFVEEENLFEPPQQVAAEPTAQFLSAVQFFPKHEKSVALLSFLMPSPVRDSPDERPWNPMLLAAMSEKTGIIVAQEMVPLAKLPEIVESFLLKIFKAERGIPAKIGTHHLPLAEILLPICQKMGIQLFKLSGDEPFLTEFMEIMSPVLRH